MIRLYLLALAATVIIAQEFWNGLQYRLYRGRRWLHLRNPWRVRIVESLPGVPELFRSVMAFEGRSDAEIIALWAKVKERRSAEASTQ